MFNAGWTAQRITVPVQVPAPLTVRLDIEEEDTPLDGNASAWGEPDDTTYANAIRARLEDGDVWAWAVVRVTVTDGVLEGTAYLGGCTYADAADFCTNGPLQYLIEEARDDWQAQAECVAETVQQLRQPA